LLVITQVTSQIPSHQNHLWWLECAWAGWKLRLNLNTDLTGTADKARERTWARKAM